MLRTHNCNELREKDIGKRAVLCGWIDSLRIQGKIGFLNLRDRYGLTQVFLNPNLTKEFSNLRKESILKIEGKVQKRPQENKELATGKIEVSADKIEVISEAEPLPMELDIKSTEETRLKYRFLDLRKKNMQDNLIIRHKIIKAMCDFLDKGDFIEIETPILAKSTPEGARDYLVPSRIYPGKFFALPQSPQMFKQLLMIAGYDKYFQIARCLRDEDLRADRQPEFTQLDIEMSFIDEEDVFSLIERLIHYVFKSVLNKDLKIPFQKIGYKEAMEKYKSDKPNLSKEKDDFKFLWVTDFPLFTFSEKEGRIVSEHHPFTAPKESDINKLEKEPLKVVSRSYDLVLNGYEIASGSIRINNVDLQRKIFKVLKLTDKEIEEKFGFFLNAMRYGTPIHGGIALGLDRIIAIITGNNSIREVIAFPKNKDARDLMLDSPSEIKKEQLDELFLKLK